MFAKCCLVRIWALGTGPPRVSTKDSNSNFVFFKFHILVFKGWNRIQLLFNLCEEKKNETKRAVGTNWSVVGLCVYSDRNDEFLPVLTLP